MAVNESLAKYLNDHLAGATAGLEVADKLVEACKGTGSAAVLQEVRDDIEADKTTLEELMQRLEVEPQTVKRVAGWVAEKATRLRLNQAATGDPALARLMELEALSMGIVGKHGLWQSLQHVAASDMRLAELDTSTLLKRAQSQLDRLEPLRLGAATAAFADD